MLAPLYKTVGQSGSQDIIDFLKKPFRLAAGSFATTDSTNLGTYSLPHAMISNANNPVAYHKILGAYMMRADIVLTLTINAVRFQQGRYILAFCPSGGAPTSSNAYTAFYRAHACNLMQVSQLPHVEIDICGQTSVQLVIPYSSAKTHYKLSTLTDYASAGYCWIQPYSALVAGSGPTSVPYTLWANFDNIELTGATVVQSGFKAKSVSEKEQSSAGVGPVSGMLARISKASGILAEVPLLASVASPLSWAAEILSRSAKALGFSKPIVLNLPNRVHRSAIAYPANGDGSSTAQPLGLCSTNEVTVYSGAGATAIDEMSIDFIKQQYAYYATYTWTTSNSAGDSLFSLASNPLVYYTATANYYTFAPVRFLANSFRYWRGGLKFRFKLVKTEFHSGRLVVSFVPWQLYESGALTATLANTDYVHRDIIDIRTTSEFEICTPYVSNDLYQFSDNGYVPGYLVMHVLDPLVAPSSVSSSISILLEVGGNSDLEFAVPAGEDWDVFIPPVVQSGFSVFPCSDMGTDSSSLIPSSVAIGEKVESIRQLLKRVDWRKPVTTIPTATAGQTLKVYPFMINNTMQFGSAVGNIYKGSYHTDNYSKWSLCYSLASGGVRLLFSPMATTTSTYTHVFMDVDSTITAPPDVSTYNTADVAQNCTFAPVNLNVDGYVNVQIPAYNRLVARPVCTTITNPTVAVAWPASNPSSVEGANLLRVTIRAQDYSSSSTDSYQWYRSVADDFNLSMWCGTVPMIPPGTHIP
jgi:hypothetical protein